MYLTLTVVIGVSPLFCITAFRVSSATAASAGKRASLKKTVAPTTVITEEICNQRINKLTIIISGNYGGAYDVGIGKS
jgi:hypothetical protein